MRVGLISDTHGLLRPQVVEFLRGCDHLVHAGDITDAVMLEDLARLAPVTAVRGNNDKGDWARMQLHETEMVQLGGVWLYVIHDLSQIDIDPAGAGVQVVVSGHTHRPFIDERNGVLFVNPGSAGPRRFRLPIAAAELLIGPDGGFNARIVEFETDPAPAPAPA